MADRGQALLAPLRANTAESDTFYFSIANRENSMAASHHCIVSNHSILSRVLRPFVRPHGRGLKDLGLELYGSIKDDDVVGRSAQLAYYFFFSIFPGFIFLSSLPGLLGPRSALRENLMVHLSSFLPPEAFGILQQTFNGGSHNAGKITFGALIALWSATAGMAAACSALNAVYDIAESRSYWTLQLIAFSMTLAAAILLIFAFVALFWGDAAIRLLSVSDLAWPLFLLIKMAQWSVAFVCLALVFALTYFWAPDRKQSKWHWITPGAALATVLWLIATIALRLYFHFFTSYSVAYGTVGAVMILLTWFYVAGFALLVGGEVNAVIENAAAQQGDIDATAKGKKSPPTL
jgi:membrane protein